MNLDVLHLYIVYFENLTFINLNLRCTHYLWHRCNPKILGFLWIFFFDRSKIMLQTLSVLKEWHFQCYHICLYWIFKQHRSLRLHYVNVYRYQINVSTFHNVITYISTTFFNTLIITFILTSYAFVHIHDVILTWYKRFSIHWSLL